jgi:hypothetical protein
VVGGDVGGGNGGTHKWVLRSLQMYKHYICVLFYFIYFMLFYFILFYFILFYFILFYFIFILKATVDEK